MGACALLPRIVGQGRAAELLFTGRSMSADEAAAWGFFNRLVAAESVWDESLHSLPSLRRVPRLRANDRSCCTLNGICPWTKRSMRRPKPRPSVCDRDFGRAYPRVAAKQKPQFRGQLRSCAGVIPGMALFHTVTS